jgi:hypothetical protein
MTALANRIFFMGFAFQWTEKNRFKGEVIQRLLHIGTDAPN